MIKLKLIPIVILLTSFSSLAQDEDLVGYDSIVKDLNTTTLAKRSPGGEMSFADIKLHSGVGIATSFVTLRPENGNTMNGFMRGVEFNFGIDLFSRNWLAEMAVRSYQPDDIDNDTQISMREFDLKVTYQSYFAKNLQSRFTAGVAARYMRFRSRDAEVFENDRYSTPASILASGLQFSINRAISLGTDVAYRTALIDDSVDRSSFDASFRVNAEF